MAIVNALQLEVTRRRASRSALFLTNFVLHTCAQARNNLARCSKI